MADSTSEDTSPRYMESPFRWGFLIGFFAAASIASLWLAFAAEGTWREVVAGLTATFVLFLGIPYLWGYYGGAVRRALGIDTVEPFYWKENDR